MASIERLISALCPVMAGKCLNLVAVFGVERETRDSPDYVCVDETTKTPEIQHLTSAALPRLSGYHCVIVSVYCSRSPTKCLPSLNPPGPEAQPARAG